MQKKKEGEQAKQAQKIRDQDILMVPLSFD